MVLSDTSRLDTITVGLNLGVNNIPAAVVSALKSGHRGVELRPGDPTTGLQPARDVSTQLGKDQLVLLARGRFTVVFVQQLNPNPKP